MMRVFLSLPFAGRSDERVEQEISYMKSWFYENRYIMEVPQDGEPRFRKIKKEEVQFVDGRITVECEANIAPTIGVRDCFKGRVYCLGEAIKVLSTCDEALFSTDYDIAKGCRVEMAVCDMYHIPRLIVDPEINDKWKATLSAMIRSK